MKGVAAWIWIIVGVVLGIVVVVFGSKLIFDQLRSTEKAMAIQNFYDLYYKFNHVCTREGVGALYRYKIALPESVTAIYVANSSDEPPPAKVSVFISLATNSVGNFFCIKFNDENIPRCESLSCQTKMTYIGTPSQKSDLLALISRLAEGSPVFKYEILINKTAQNFLFATTRPNITIPTTTTTSTTSATTTQTNISTSTTPTQLCQYTPEQLANLVDSSKMISDLQYLTSQPRVFRSQWNKQTADYIQNKLQSYGLQNVKQESYSGPGYNVVGEIGSGKDDIVVLGAHRDTVSVPGAVDNGGGTVIVMEIARVLSTCKNNAKNNIRFVLFDGEEVGLTGSIAYARAHIDAGENVIKMMNFDCEGHKDSSELTVYRTAGDLASVADQCCRSLNIPCNIDGQFSMPGASSDHAPFQTRGVQYLWPMTSCNQFHTSGDNMSEIDGERLKWAAQLAVCVAAKNYITTT